jgi:tetratricopeptide (TPR) repeat protein
MKRYVAGLILLALSCVLPTFAQEKQNFVFTLGTPEGNLLQSLGQETDDAHKVSIGEEFLSKFPKHPAAGWVAAQVESGLLGQMQYDKVLEVAEMAYMSTPDMDGCYYALKAAVAKGDEDQIKKWSERTSEMARKTVASIGTPSDDDAKHQLQYAKEVDEYSEYALYVVALKAQPKEQVDLVDTLIQRNPKSQYLPLVSATYFAALEKAGEGKKICPEAEKMSAGASKNAEAMLVAANCSMTAQKGAGMVSYGEKALEAVNSRTKEEGMSDAEWAAKKEGIVANANWYVGVGYSLEGKWGPANKTLRAALPMLKNNEQFRGMCLFYLGLANYNMGKAIGDRGQIRQGLQFFQQAAAVSNPMQDQASRNAKLVATELGGR